MKLIEQIFTEGRPLLDVRAPCEFDKGAFPQSVNLPIIDDSQREQIGVCYKQHGQEKAIELGHQLVDESSRRDKVEGWSDFAHAYPNGFLYCFRGGKRSQYAQQWLKENNVEYPLVPGGYKKMRQWLLEQLEHFSATLPFTLISGKTGSGKTELLHQLPHRIDLEALANHRGSSFGATLTAQPNTINFENSLSISLIQLAQLNPQAVYLEDEGKLIGRLAIPQTLRERMLTLPCALLVESIEKRVQISANDYVKDLMHSYCAAHGRDAGIQRFTAHHKDALNKIKKRFGQQQIRVAENLFDEGMHTYLTEDHIRGFDEYIKHLLVDYYDPMYEYQFNSKNRKILFSGNSTEVVDWCLRRQGAG